MFWGVYCVLDPIHNGCVFDTIGWVCCHIDSLDKDKPLTAVSTWSVL